MTIPTPLMQDIGRFGGYAAAIAHYAEMVPKIDGVWTPPYVINIVALANALQAERDALSAQLDFIIGS